MEIIDAMLRGGGIATAITLGFLFTRRGLKSPIGLFGTLQALTIAGFLICTAPWLKHEGPAWWISSTVCHYIPFVFWLFSRAVFGDVSRVGKTEAIGALAYTPLVAAYVWAQLQGHAGSPSAVTEAVNDLFRLVGLGFGLYVMFDVIREYRNDLIERRRRIRLYMVGAVGTVFTALVVNNIISDGQAPRGQAGVITSAAILVLCIGLILMITRLRRDLFPLAGTGSQSFGAPANDDEPQRPTSAPGEMSPISDKELTAVLHEMEEAKAYKDENLTIAALAERLGTQEYLLRRLINGSLGQRNFTSFLNGYRLDEVERGLSDPAQAKTPILTLALDAGFNSIGPFNRAFKERHGITPKEYRQQVLDQRSASN